MIRHITVAEIAEWDARYAGRRRQDRSDDLGAEAVRMLLTLAKQRDRLLDDIRGIVNAQKTAAEALADHIEQQIMDGPRCLRCGRPVTSPGPCGQCDNT